MLGEFVSFLRFIASFCIGKRCPIISIRVKSSRLEVVVCISDNLE